MRSVTLKKNHSLNIRSASTSMIDLTYLDLLCPGYSTEHNLGKSSVWKRAVSYSSHDSKAAFDDDKRGMGSVVHEARNVFPRHHGQLTLKDRFEPGEKDPGLGRRYRVTDDVELDNTSPLFSYGRTLAYRSL
jgi:hypothetical protein